MKLGQCRLDVWRFGYCAELNVGVDPSSRTLSIIYINRGRTEEIGGLLLWSLWQCHQPTLRLPTTVSITVSLLEDPALAIYLAKIVYFVQIPTRKFYLHSTVVYCTDSDYKKQLIFS